MEGRNHTLIYTFLLYGGAFALGIVAAWRHVITPGVGMSAGSLELTWQNGVIFALVFTVFTVVMVKFVRVAHASLSLFLLIALLAGGRFVLSAWIPSPFDILSVVVLLLLFRFVPIVLTHDLAIVLGIAGISALLGLSITPLIACVVLAALSLYDIFSVYRSRHMVALAEHMMESGAVFGFLVPTQFKGFFMDKTKALGERNVMMLGSGDIGLPLVLATSAVSQSLWAAGLVAGFSLAGLILMQWIFVHQRHEGAPMAALPPIAMSAILGYVLAIILGI
jgi:presenilin-like A22 family membrane protease